MFVYFCVLLFTWERNHEEQLHHKLKEVSGAGLFASKMLENSKMHVAYNDDLNFILC